MVPFYLVSAAGPLRHEIRVLAEFSYNLRRCEALFCERKLFEKTLDTDLDKVIYLYASINWRSCEYL